MTERRDRLAWREYAHRTARGYLYVLAPAIAVLFVVQLLLGNETKPQILFIPAAFAWFGWLGTRRLAPKAPAVEPAPTAPRWELKAPNPAPGQCPVCGLTDLAERAVGDELLGDAGTALARVVAYGPDRAHSECAAVVPYVAPTRSTSGGTRPHAHFGFYTPGPEAKWTYCGCEKMREGNACAAVPLSGGRRMCLAHNEGDPRCTVYPRAVEPKAPKRGKLHDAFVSAMAEEAAALGEKLQRELGLQPPSVRDRVAAQMDAHLTWAGSHSWEQWQAHGFETRVEAAAWYRLGFTPWRAQSWRQAGFTDPDAVARTGRTWPIESPGRE